LHPESLSEWVWELKYVKTADAENQTLIAEKRKKSIEQLQRYKNSNLFKDRTDVRFIAVVFIGKNGYISCELDKTFPI
jgi:hypothetical protein